MNITIVAPFYPTSRDPMAGIFLKRQLGQVIKVVNQSVYIPLFLIKHYDQKYKERNIHRRWLNCMK